MMRTCYGLAYLDPTTTWTISALEFFSTASAMRWLSYGFRRSVDSLPVIQELLWWPMGLLDSEMTNHLWRISGDYQEFAQVVDADGVIIAYLFKGDQLLDEP